MIKTEIIGFCQKINRIGKLVELSDTLTNNGVGGMDAVAKRGCWDKRFLFAHQISYAHIFLKILQILDRMFTIRTKCKQTKNANETNERFTRMIRKTHDTRNKRTIHERTK